MPYRTVISKLNYLEKCPICDWNFKRDGVYMSGMVLEDYFSCVNPKCGDFHYEFVTGYASYFIGKRDSSEHFSNDFSPIMLKKIEDMRLKYQEKYGLTGNAIIDCFDIT